MYDMEPKYKVGDQVKHVTAGPLSDAMLVIGVMFEKNTFCYYCRWNVHGAMHTSFFAEHELEDYHDPKTWDTLQKELRDLRKQVQTLESDLEQQVVNASSEGVEEEENRLLEEHRYFIMYSCLWYHEKSGNVYFIVNGKPIRIEREGMEGQRYISYQKAQLTSDCNNVETITGEPIWVRPVIEFLDGRFTSISTSKALEILTQQAQDLSNAEKIKEREQEDKFAAALEEKKPGMGDDDEIPF